MPNPWDSRNTDNTHADVKEGLETTNILGDIWGALSGGNKDPIQQWADSQYGGMTGNEGSYNTIRWAEGDQDVYNQMDKSQWDALANKRISYQRGWIENRKKELANGATPGKFWDPKTGKEMEQEDPLDAKMQEFYRRMMAPLDMNDPEVQRITNTATSISNREAANRGIQGGMSVSGATGAALDAQGQLTAQRQGMAQNMLGTMSGRDLQLKTMANQNAKDAYASSMAQKQAGGALIGGLIGGSKFGKGWGFDAKSGAALGGGMGGMSAGGFTPPSLSRSGMTGGVY